LAAPAAGSFSHTKSSTVDGGIFTFWCYRGTSTAVARNFKIWYRGCHTAVAKTLEDTMFRSSGSEIWKIRDLGDFKGFWASRLRRPKISGFGWFLMVFWVKNRLRREKFLLFLTLILMVSRGKTEENERRRREKNRVFVVF
jgi:hypothetical protein